MSHTDLDIVDAYIQHGSVWAAAEALGMVGQTVHRRLTKIGAIKKLRVFTESEAARTKEYYETADPKNFSIEPLAQELGRTRQFISRQAAAMGLTNRQRVVSTRKKATPLLPGEVRPHPRGALGLKHSDAAKDRISQASRLAWATQKTFGLGNMSESARQAKSDRMSSMRAEQPAENAYSRAKHGRRADIGDMFFRSAWEANYARYLNWLVQHGDIDRWEYEAETFWFLAIKRGVRSYKPDFKIWEKGRTYFVEIKGWMDPKSKTKLRRMKKYHPEIRIDVVGAKQYADLKSKMSRMIAGWEA